MEKGLLPGNLHYKSPNPFSEGLARGTLQVVDSTRPWQGGLCATNSFGFGGTNVHAVLEEYTGDFLPPPPPAATEHGGGGGGDRGPRHGNRRREHGQAAVAASASGGLHRFGEQLPAGGDCELRPIRLCVEGLIRYSLGAAHDPEHGDVRVDLDQARSRPNDRFGDEIEARSLETPMQSQPHRTGPPWVESLDRALTLTEVGVDQRILMEPPRISPSQSIAPPQKVA